MVDVGRQASAVPPQINGQMLQFEIGNGPENGVRELDEVLILGFDIGIIEPLDGQNPELVFPIYGDFYIGYMPFP